ncbi:MAG: hypothetical protein NVS9B10_22260 [Nevskia sp.]
METKLVIEGYTMSSIPCTATERPPATVRKRTKAPKEIRPRTFADVADEWRESERRILAMASRLYGKKTRAEDYSALLSASVACESKARFYDDLAAKFPEHIVGGLS